MFSEGSCGDWPQLFSDSSPTGSVYYAGDRFLRFGLLLYCTAQRVGVFAFSSSVARGGQVTKERYPYPVSCRDMPPGRLKNALHRDAKRTKSNMKLSWVHGNELFSATMPAFAIPFRTSEIISQQEDAAGRQLATSVRAPCSTGLLNLQRDGYLSLSLFFRQLD